MYELLESRLQSQSVSITQSTIRFENGWQNPILRKWVYLATIANEFGWKFHSRMQVTAKKFEDKMLKAVGVKI